MLLTDGGDVLLRLTAWEEVAARRSALRSGLLSARVAALLSQWHGLLVRMVLPALAADALSVVFAAIARGIALSVQTSESATSGDVDRNSLGRACIQCRLTSEVGLIIGLDEMAISTGLPVPLPVEVARLQGLLALPPIV